MTMGQVRRQSVGIVEDAKSQASLGRRLRVLGPAAANLRKRVVGLGPDDLVFTFIDGRVGRSEVAHGTPTVSGRGSLSCANWRAWVNASPRRTGCDTLTSPCATRQS